MTIPRTLALSLIICWLLTACDHATPVPATDQIALVQTVVTGVTPTSQPYSPVLIPTMIPEATIAPTIAAPITTVVATDFSSNADLTKLTWQGDTLMTGFSEGQPQHEYLKFKPTTVIWQRDRTLLRDLQVGDWVALFGVNYWNEAAVDYMVILPEPSAAFAETGEYTQEHLAIGQVASISADTSSTTVTLSLVDNPLPFRASQTTRIFRQHRATLAELEEGSWISYIGTILRIGEKTLFEIDRAVILHTPSQYSAETFPLLCDITKEIAHCHDEYLDITFTHPANWGEAVGVLSQSRYVGYSYEYRFTRQFESSISAAGGRSDQFMEPRDGFFTDYSGSDGRVLEDRCATPDFMLCELVQPGVELMIRRASAEALCNPGPGIIWRPTAFIAVDLPDHPTINGLLFVTNFLSTALSEELAAVEPQPYPPQAAPINCDEAGRLRYEESMKQLAQQLHDNTLDAETQANLQALRAMAASFRGAAMPGD